MGRVLEALPPLYRRVRAQSAERLEARLGASNGDGGTLTAAVAVAGLRAAIEDVAQKARALDKQLADFTRRFNEAQDEDARREVLRAHIHETVPHRNERRADEKALERFLDFDALRERLERRRRLLLIDEETAARALRGILRTATDEERPRLSAELPPLFRTLLARAVQTPRQMNRVALLEALAQVAKLSANALQERPEDLLSLRALAEEAAHGPWVRSAALDVLWKAAPEDALGILRVRRDEEDHRDFLFRRQALETAARALEPGRLVALLDEVTVTDSSEWVRMGAAELSALQPGGVSVLRKLCGRSSTHEEPSPKVRAAAVVALSNIVRGDLVGQAEAAALLHEVVTHEGDSLVLRIACEQLFLCADLFNDALLTPLHAAAHALTLKDDAPGPLVEAAAKAAQALARSRDPVRRSWTEHLRKAARALPMGGRTKLTVEPAPEGLPPLPEDEAWLGAVLADLSADDYGLYAERSGNVLRLWRGEGFSHRAWRIAHELTHPAPNKRQGFGHTVGRTYSGRLRAHPWRMDEITQTNVPGERVHVAEDGSWGRHLPTVDDLLDLPLSGEPVRLFSSHGVTTLTPPASLSRRIKNRLVVTRQYEKLAQLRLSSLRGREPRERRRFAREVEKALGVQVAFKPYVEDAAPGRVGALFGLPQGNVPGPAKGAQAPAKGDGGANALKAFAVVEAAWLTQVMDVLVDRSDYFLGTRGNGVMALAVFTAALFTLFLGDAWRKRESVRQARAQLPLCIGGWGTRGKSGSERLKAALFAGMGFDVFAKTTGSEAMFVHTTPAGASTEFFIYRPYDKATIWEQRDMAQLASRMGVEVFLWECMALQPAFVDLLQNEWMHDDFATLTNAYPDHEDIQGPAGKDVAEVITRFMPEGSTVVTTEDHFLPLFREAAAKKNTRLVHSPWWEAELMPQELLRLFPYDEHPRNMALVATLASELGVSRTMALGLMAEHVQPEIGVLKQFGPARVRGRKLTFINGHSANERTGFLNNWKRTGLDRVSPDDAPHRAVVTVINNRWDRVARSEVFARILVDDAAADRHVLIGTNLEGLQKYIRAALDQALDGHEVVTPDDLSQGPEGIARAQARLDERLAFLRIPTPTRAAFFARLAVWARGAGLGFAPTEALATAVDEVLASRSTELRPERVREALSEKLGALLDAALPNDSAVASADESGAPEAVEPATSEDLKTHALWALARMVVAARLRAALPRPDEEDKERACRRFHQLYRTGYRELFLEKLVVVHDPKAKGDQIVDACAKAVPPGCEASIMGAQNIKGTGLDWVYRWLALDRAERALTALERGAGEERQRAIETLESAGDHGIIDAALCAARLPSLAERAQSHMEAERLRTLASRMRALHEVKLRQLDEQRGSTRTEKWLAQAERILDYLDSVRRRKMAERLVDDLVNERVSHARAALETRRLYERQKGGWLFAGKKAKRAALADISAGAKPLPAEGLTVQVPEGAKGPAAHVDTNQAAETGADDPRQ